LGDRWLLGAELIPGARRQNLVSRGGSRKREDFCRMLGSEMGLEEWTDGVKKNSPKQPKWSESYHKTQVKTLTKKHSLQNKKHQGSLGGFKNVFLVEWSGKNQAKN